MLSFDSGASNAKGTALANLGYKFVKKLGDGTFANVFLAEYTSKDGSGQRINLACKVVNSSKLIKQKVLSHKFIHRELTILAKLNHPYIINVHNILQWFNKYYIFMSYAENGDLLQFIHSKKEMIPEHQSRIWFRQLALGVQYIHEMEIAHRDIKCENILLTSDMNIKLADFGFARYVIDDDGKRVLSDTYCGSFYYMAPEVLIGTPYNPKMSDMWSMGVILFIMLNKATPFKVDDIKRMYQQQIQRRYKFRNKVINLASDYAKKIVDNLLEPFVNQRWTMDKVLNCKWFAMDPQLTTLTLEEQEALNSAINERKKNEERIKNKQKDTTDKLYYIKEKESELKDITQELFYKDGIKIDENSESVLLQTSVPAKKASNKEDKNDATSVQQ